MNLRLKRTSKTAEACLGVLEVDGSFECYTLEDPDGAGDRIDVGTYNVITNFSNRFQKIMPLLTGPKVDGRGIRIHCGNTQADTEGCILLGTEHGRADVENSRIAFTAFYTKLSAALSRGEIVTLAVEDETPTNTVPPLGARLSQPDRPTPNSAVSQGFSVLKMLLSLLKK